MSISTTWGGGEDHTPGWGGATWGKSEVASSFQFCVWKGGFETAKLCESVYTRKGGGFNLPISWNVWKGYFPSNVHFFACIWDIASVWKVCGKGVIFIDTFHTIRVLSNFARRAGYTTFPSNRLPGIIHGTGRDMINQNGLEWKVGPRIIIIFKLKV